MVNEITCETEKKGTNVYLFWILFVDLSQQKVRQLSLHRLTFQLKKKKKKNEGHSTNKGNFFEKSKIYFI